MVKQGEYAKILSDKMTPGVQKLGREGTFQHDNKSKHWQNYIRLSEELLKKITRYNYNSKSHQKQTKC